MTEEKQTITDIVENVKIQLSLCPYEVDGFQDAAETLYTNTREIKTRKGLWVVYERENFAIPYFNPKLTEDLEAKADEQREETTQNPVKEFLAMYRYGDTNGKIRNLVNGIYSSKETVDQVLNYLTEEILEKRIITKKRFRLPWTKTEVEEAKQFPNEGLNYEYASFNVKYNVSDEKEEFDCEQRLTIYHQYLKTFGIETSKDYFEHVYRSMKEGLDEGQEGMNEHLKLHPEEPVIPFRVIVNMYSTSLEDLKIIINQASTQ